MTQLRCIAVDDEPLALDVIENHLSSFKDFKLVAKCNNAIEASECVKNQDIDLIFLDIQMPEISGISFARSLDKPPMIIFTTAYSEYAVEGFELKAVDYLLKPISFSRFERAIEKVREYNQLRINVKQAETTELDSEHIFIKANQKLIKIRYDEIQYVEAFADYVKIFIPEKRIVTLQTMKKMEQKLPPHLFQRIHRSFIIGINHIDSYSTSEVEINGVKMPIGKNYKSAFIELMKGNNTL
jgi:DNA-binding LytR/AlgR family response regulator